MKNNVDNKKNSKNLMDSVDKKGTTEETDYDFDITEWVDDLMNDAPLDKDLLKNQEEDSLIEKINESLAKQVCQQLDGIDTTTTKTSTANLSDETQENGKKSKVIKIATISLATLLCIIIIFVATPGGRSILWDIATNYAYGRMKYDDGKDVINQVVEDDVVEDLEDIKEEEVKEEEIIWNTEPKTENGPRSVEGIINILLIGEEAIDSGNNRGRTDIMIIATMNTKEKTYKLTSLMRDMYVRIPDHKDNKLNSAYEAGGVPLLYETIEKNFDIKMDGYVLVGFDDFEKIINELGGVKLTLTAEEAKYLQTTNYISKPEYRDVITGTQVMNGNQALGYCRIRDVPTGDKLYNDYGRTSRQRVLLDAIFEQYKSKSLPDLALKLNNILPMITTDITKDEFEYYLKTAVSIGFSEISNLRIPADHTFEEAYVRTMSVLIPDLDANKEVLHKFIFGETE